MIYQIPPLSRRMLSGIILHMRKITLAAVLPVLLVPALLRAEAWRPSDFEIRGWNAVMSETNVANSVFSPIGLAISVAMLGEGTGGTHRANIAESFGLLSDFGNAFSYVFKSYAAASASNAVSITVAPSLWSRQPNKLDLDYRHSLLRNFEAETGNLQHLLSINAWTEAKTDGRIPEIVSEIPPHTDILLLNAIAFEGAWEKGFDPAQTTQDDFRCEDGTTRKVPMMHGERLVTRVQSADYAAIRLPFAAPGISMLYLLPSEKTKIAAFRSRWGKDLSIDELKSLFRVGTGAEVSTLSLKLAVPHMEIDSRWSLRPIISAFKVPVSGYARIGADFKIDAILQAAYVKVSETGYSLTPGVVPPPKQEEPMRPGWRGRREREEAPPPATESFLLNRPFVFLVWDETTDTIILAGQFNGR